MSKAKTRWKRAFGLQESRWTGRDPDRRPLPDDCNIVVTDPALREAGATNPARARRALERDGRFHHYIVVFPDGRRAETTHETSLAWIVGVQRDEGLDRSRANLLVGRRAPLETAASQPGPFVPEIFRVPIAPPAPSPPAPAREARRRQAAPPVDVARNDRELDSALLDLLCSDALRLLTAADAPLRRGDLAAELGLEHSKEDRLALSKVIYRLKTEGYHVAP